MKQEEWRRDACRKIMGLSRLGLPEPSRHELRGVGITGTASLIKAGLLTETHHGGSLFTYRRHRLVTRLDEI